MRLLDALELRPHEVVSFVGAGGKTTAMFRLAVELASEGRKVITTTTTKLAEKELKRVPHYLALENLPDLALALNSDDRHSLLFHSVGVDRKLRGFLPSWVDVHMVEQGRFDALLIEADGSRRLPIKAPLVHEPPIPTKSSLVISVVGLSALGQPLDDEHVYGLETIVSTIGYLPGQTITEAVIATMMSHPSVGLKNTPSDARVVVLLNQMSKKLLPRARKIADMILQSPRIERVLIGSVKARDPIQESRRKVGAIVLAAGKSTRMALTKPKVLLEWGESTIIRRVCEQIASAGLTEIVVVTGERTNEIAHEVAGLPARVARNADYDAGEMLSSLRVGLDALEGRCQACLIALGDQPTIELETIHKVLDAYARGEGKIVAPSYQNRRGHPLLIDRAYWQAIRDLPSGSAPRDMLRANEQAIHYVVVNTPSALEDIDTPEDYEALARLSRSRRGR